MEKQQNTLLIGENIIVHNVCTQSSSTHQQTLLFFTFIKEEIIEAGIEGDLWIKSPIPGMATHLHGDERGEIMLNNYFDTDTGHL